MRRTRRRLLGTLGSSVASLALAGCLVDGTGPDDDTHPGGTATDGTPADGSPTDGTPPDPSGGVTVRRVTVLPELVSRTAPDAYGIYGAKGSQHVVAEVSVESPADHPESAFAVETPDTSVDVVTEVGHSLDFLAGFGRAYEHGERDAGWLAARLPKPLEAETAALTWNGGRHAFDAAVLEALRREPATVEPTLSAPDRAALGDTVTATVTVENTADVDGTFVGALNRSGPRIASVPETAVVLPVPAGGTATWTFEHLVAHRGTPDGETRMTFYLQWRGERRFTEVAIGPDATPTATADADE